MANVRSPHRILHTDFRSGELDPRLMMRVDNRNYASGARTLKNVLIHTTGAVSRRPGMRKLATLNQRSRLVEFEFDADENYVLAFGNNHLRIYNPDGTTAATFSGSTDCPWTTTTTWELTVAQRADVMIICHGSFKPKKLTRTGLSTFTIADFAFDTRKSGAIVLQPHIKYELATTTLAISATAIGTGRTLTSNPGIFSSAWIGQHLRIFGNEIEITGFTNSTTATATVHQKVKTRLDPNPFRLQNGSGVVEVTHVAHGLADSSSVTISGCDGAATLGISNSNIDGTKTITLVDDDHYTITASASDVADDSGDTGGTSVDIESTAATQAWTEPVFSAIRGWPSAVCFHENRLWLGGCDEEPSGLFGSVIGDYFDFDLQEGEDDASIQVSLSSPRFARIRHLVSSRQLQAFTEGVEITVDGGEGEPLTPGSVRAVVHTTYGCGFVRPRIFDGATVFVQDNGKTVRELIFDFGVNGFQAPSLSSIASHLVQSPNDMAILHGSSTRPEQYVFIVNADGSAACFHSIRSEELAAWTRFAAGGGGLFDAVCAIGPKVYFSVKRGSSYFLERFELDETDIWLDFATEMTGASSATWALGSDYANATVTVMSNGRVQGVFTANGSGTITLSNAVTNIVAGYDYGIQIIPTPPDKEMVDGPMTGEKRRTVSATIHVHETVSLSAGGVEMFGPQAGEVFSDPPVLYSEKRRIRMFGWDRDPDLDIMQPLAGPCTVLGMSREVSI